MRQGAESAFPKAEYDARIAGARALLATAGLDAMIVTGPENIFYLTGQQTPGYYAFQALVLATDGDPVFIVRQLEYFNFIANTFIADAAVYQDGDQPVDFLAEIVRSARARRQAHRHRQARLVPARRGLRGAPRQARRDRGRGGPDRAASHGEVAGRGGEDRRAPPPMSTPACVPASPP